MKTINIFASDLAVALGINRYQKLSDLILKLWQKISPKDYQETLNKLQDQYKVKFQVKEEDLDYVNKISKENKLDIDDKLKECLKLEDTTELHKERNNIVKLINENEKLDDKTKKDMKKSLFSATNKNFGTKNEKSVLDLYSEKYEKKLLTPAKFVKKKILEYKDYRWYIGGRIDGITDDYIVIEVKNRIYKLFNEMKDYERPQLQAYMFINGLKKGHLVECHKSKGDKQINVIEENFDEEYWEKEVMGKLKKFIKLFHLFLEDINLKTFVLLGDEREREEILKRYIG